MPSKTNFDLCYAEGITGKIKHGFAGQNNNQITLNIGKGN